MAPDEIKGKFSFSELKDVVAEPLQNIVALGGKLGSIFAVLSISSALIRISLPQLNEDLGAFLPLLPKHPYLPVSSPTSLLSFVSIFSALMFFLIVTVNFILTEIHNLTQKITIRWNNVIMIFIKFLHTFSKNKGILKFLSKLTIFSEKKVFFKDYWKAESNEGWAVLEAPYTIGNFKYAKSNVKLIKTTEGYWRIGIFFRDEQNNEYIFHVYQNHKGDFLKTRIVWRIPHVTDKKDSKKNISPRPVDIQNVSLELRKGNGSEVIFLVNDIEVDKFNVPITDNMRLFFAAWADGRSIEADFSNIEVVA